MSKQEHETYRLGLRILASYILLYNHGRFPPDTRFYQFRDVVYFRGRILMSRRDWFVPQT